VIPWAGKGETKLQHQISEHDCMLGHEGRNIKFIVTVIQYLHFSTPRVPPLSDKDKCLVQHLVSLDKTEKERNFEQVNRCWSDF